MSWPHPRLTNLKLASEQNRRSPVGDPSLLQLFHLTGLEIIIDILLYAGRMAVDDPNQGNALALLCLPCDISKGQISAAADFNGVSRVCSPDVYMKISVICP
ncbi:hypothetical protein D3C77_456340 [compost metagenome]